MQLADRIYFKRCFVSLLVDLIITELLTLQILFRRTIFIICFLWNILCFSLIYFAEKESAAQWSFPDSFWWGLMVLTTVGYGARAPHTWAGQVGPPVH